MGKTSRKVEIREAVVKEKEDVQKGNGEEQKTLVDEDIMVKLQEKEREAAENYDKYVRAVADLENYRKRAAREKADSIRYGNENLIKDILPLVDSMDRALQHADDYGYPNAFKEGLKLLQGQLQGCLEKHGVRRIECINKTFDPHIHEAVLHVDSGCHEKDQVVQELEKGYLLHERLLRPAKVSVSKGAKEEDSKECKEGD
ncbi:MAG TPA: nucleotide exchange factor GrpE [Syntrophales bacterium]|nr:nucleotide exchange factor GrpE [Syntrophales bacterium]